MESRDMVGRPMGGVQSRDFCFQSQDASFRALVASFCRTETARVVVGFGSSKWSKRKCCDLESLDPQFFSESHSTGIAAIPACAAFIPPPDIKQIQNSIDMSHIKRAGFQFK